MSIKPETQDSQHQVVTQAAQAQQGSSTNSLGSFQSGNGANTMAVLLLIADLMKLYEFKNDQFANQAKIESTMADSYADSQKALGEQEMTEMVVQGAFSGVMGLGSAALGAYGYREDLQVQSQETELNGTQKFSNNLDSIEQKNISGSDKTPEETTPTRTEDETTITSEEEAIQTRDNDENDTKKLTAKQEERLEKMIQEIKSGNYKTSTQKGEAATLKSKEETGQEFSDQELVENLPTPERERLTEAVNDRINTQKANLEKSQRTLQNNMTHRQLAGTAVQGLTTAGGNIGAGIMKQKEGEQNYTSTEFNTALQGFQRLANETQSQADKDLDSAQSLTQLIINLDESNKAVLSA